MWFHKLIFSHQLLRQLLLNLPGSYASKVLSIRFRLFSGKQENADSSTLNLTTAPNLVFVGLNSSAGQFATCLRIGRALAALLRVLLKVQTEGLKLNFRGLSEFD